MHCDISGLKVQSYIERCAAAVLKKINGHCMNNVHVLEDNDEKDMRKFIDHIGKKPKLFSCKFSVIFDNTSTPADLQWAQHRAISINKGIKLRVHWHHGQRVQSQGGGRCPPVKR